MQGPQKAHPPPRAPSTSSALATSCPPPLTSSSLRLSVVPLDQCVQHRASRHLPIHSTLDRIHQISTPGLQKLPCAWQTRFGHSVMFSFPPIWRCWLCLACLSLSSSSDSNVKTICKNDASAWNPNNGTTAATETDAMLTKAQRPANRAMQRAEQASDHRREAEPSRAEHISEQSIKQSSEQGPNHKCPEGSKLGLWQKCRDLPIGQRGPQSSSSDGNKVPRPKPVNYLQHK